MMRWLPALCPRDEVEANLLRLNDRFKLRYIPDLVVRKQTGGEHSFLNDTDLEFHRSEYQRLRQELDAAREASA